MSKNKETIVFTLGVWDGMHIGHIRLLKNAARLGNYLIVGVVNDNIVKKVKGKARPLHDEQTRMEIVSNIKRVSLSILLKDFNPNELIESFKKTYGKEYYEECKKIFVFGEDQTHLKSLNNPNNDILIVYLKRTPDVSTSSLYFGVK